MIRANETRSAYSADHLSVFKCSKSPPLATEKTIQSVLAGRLGSIAWQARPSAILVSSTPPWGETLSAAAIAVGESKTCSIGGIPRLWGPFLLVKRLAAAPFDRPFCFRVAAAWDEITGKILALDSGHARADIVPCQ